MVKEKGKHVHELVKALGLSCLLDSPLISKLMSSVTTPTPSLKARKIYYALIREDDVLILKPKNVNANIFKKQEADLLYGL